MRRTQSVLSWTWAPGGSSMAREHESRRKETGVVRRAILGPGNWAKRLVGSVQGKSGMVKFTAAGSRAPERHGEFGEAFGIPVVPYADILARGDVDAVLFATPHSEHRDQAIAAAKGGKHVFCEKPLALTAADADAI